MRRSVCDVQEKRSIIVLDIVNHPHRMVGDHVGQIVGAGNLYSCAIYEKPRMVEVAVATFEPKHLFESALKLRMSLVGAFRIRAAMPLARYAGTITCIAQHLGNRDAAVVEIPLIRRLTFDVVAHVTDARLVRIQPC